MFRHARIVWSGEDRERRLFQEFVLELNLHGLRRFGEIGPTSFRCGGMSVRMARVIR